MKIFNKAKDGGPESPVEAYFLVEFKNFFSIALLKFNTGCRDNYHTHTFNAFTWFIKGKLVEEDISGDTYVYTRSLLPKFTSKTKTHRVRAFSTSWCFTIRGPWKKTWSEHNKKDNTITILTHGRRVVGILKQDK